ncbi:MAG: metal-dependent hydrolase [Chroococcidiopsidaceae cyanobacterium CP_BM_ER_R8_30]|nr:metal-dependent hydrolase [Chroococcidiopsidaceae cyanobacterium CP_BM_ER_R8_30]
MKTRLLMMLTVLLLFIFSLQGSALAAVKATQLTWYGQSAFKLVTPAGHVVLIDPWITNPINKNGTEDVSKINKVDLILVSHGHFDHVGQASEIANKTKARLVATYDLGGALAKYGGYPKDQMGFDTLGNFGGLLSFFNGDVRIAFIPAVHSSTVNSKELGLNDDDANHFAGAPGGFVILVKGGPNIYHTGDTDLFADMSNIAQYGRINIMLTCIGDHFTMGPERAALAVELVKPTKAVPMHYGSFPVMTGTPDKFAAALESRGLGQTFMPMTVGKTVTF